MSGGPEDQAEESCAPVVTYKGPGGAGGPLLYPRETRASSQPSRSSRTGREAKPTYIKQQEEVKHPRPSFFSLDS